ncbi:DNA_MISMATCH_REPAIR_2 domain-containing protein [Meloidogyne graminicola]|uniref:DNA_MISMATCH_REPAIR_2 domain-containing protein n=1 Tax=Meloidogyne graminicola TaxID=189291 RepID=A0A8S9ZAH3_9BILA|nr:DNA_MISMATCH_REPAIR_2 domain-containing protein [Meloidogyne graminicola]
MDSDTDFMHLDTTAQQALDIFSIGSESNHCGASITLHDHLNRCRSSSGKRLIHDWLCHPLISLSQIEVRLDIVEALYSCASVRQSLHENLLRRVPDVGVLSRKLEQGKSTLSDCYRLYQLVLLIRRVDPLLCSLKTCVTENIWTSINELILKKIQQSNAELRRFSQLIENTLDFDYFEQNGQHRIQPNIDPQLKELNSQIDKMNEEAQDLRKKWQIKQNSETFLRSVSGVRVLDSTKGGGVRFFTSKLDQLNGQYLELLRSYESNQEELTKLVLSTCAGYVPSFKLLDDHIGTLDVLTSFSIVTASSATPYIRPKILEKGNGLIDLRKCRHPTVERLPNIHFIPNDVQLGQSSDGRDSARFMILTGANMGGKSTYLKAAALTILLGQIGCFVPCEMATFSIVDGIFTRVGAGDYQFKGISTFMAEMIDCNKILESATSNSLILIDELGRGTSTYDGFGLAWSISEDIICRLNCFTLFATHFHEISELEKLHPGKVKNNRMDTFVEEGNLVILFQVVPGVAQKSFGLEIAQLVGFSKEILDDAEEILHELEGKGIKENEFKSSTN